MDWALTKEHIEALVKESSEDFTRRWDLAKKILNGDKLNNTEKAFIFKKLTGIEAQTIKHRGRPSDKIADSELAFEYLSMLAWEGIDLHTVKVDLYKKYKLGIKPGLPYAENTFHHALKRGLVSLEKRANSFFDKLNNGSYNYDNLYKTLEYPQGEALNDYIQFKDEQERLLQNQISYWTKSLELIARFRELQNITE